MSWKSISRGLRRGSERFFFGFGERMKKEFGLDLDAAVERSYPSYNELVPRFLEWNRWEMWKVRHVNCLFILLIIPF